uniref:F-box domain-containing protein n=1 Tax=Solanum lycopersicum TaxID=4081 RepID=K4CA92_SOLLC|nr:putative F-box protein At1g32420 [Solanum lycopersicum]
MEITKICKRQKKHVMSIPKEVVMEILQRVPGKDLAEKLKMVCMQWCSIIYSGSFAYSHIKQIIKSSSFSQLEAVIIKEANDQQSITVSSLEWHNYCNQNRDEFEHWETKDLYTTKIVSAQPRPMLHLWQWQIMKTANSMNGFICFWSRHDACFHIFNPVSKEHVITPTYTHKGLQNGYVAMGFGFCPVTYEYKVVVLYDTNSNNIKPLVFTIGRDKSWRALKDIPHKNFANEVQAVVYLKGKLYWSGENVIGEEIVNTLICFDVSKEEFEIVVAPIEIPEGPLTVAENRGRLSDRIDDDLSNLNSWKIKFCVTLPSIAYRMDGLGDVYLVKITDEILLIQLDKKNWGLFHVTNGKLLGLIPLPYFVTAAIPYVPSLVALRHRPLLASSSYSP